jgi:hypothetical protein
MQITQQRGHGPAPLVLCAGLGLASLAAYAAHSFVLPRARNFAAERTAVISQQWSFWRWLAAGPAPSLPTLLALVAGVALAAVTAYGLALLLSRRAAPTGRLAAMVLSFAALFYLVEALALPNSGRDLFGYIIYARVLGIYGANPYTVAPATFPTDQFLGFAEPGWTTSTTPYGPA